MEKPQLEEQRSELLLSIAQDTEILEELENKSLRLLQVCHFMLSRDL